MKTESIERARTVVKHLHKRNQSTWDELDRETVHAINSLVAYAEWLKSPPKREWVGLTDEELKPLCAENHIIYGAYTVDFIHAIEAKLKEKNT